MKLGTMLDEAIISISSVDAKLRIQCMAAILIYTRKGVSYHYAPDHIPDLKRLWSVLNILTKIIKKLIVNLLIITTEI